MTGILHSTLGRRLKRLRKQEDGNSTIEFVILFPIFMVLFMSTFEIGLVMIRQVMLDRATDMTVRALRIGEWKDPTYDGVKAAICDAALILPDCSENLRLNLNTISKQDWAFPSGLTYCVDKSEEIQPVTSFTLGLQHEMMLVEVCALQEPMFPLTGLGMRMPKVHGDFYALMSQSAFVNEPG